MTTFRKGLPEEYSYYQAGQYASRRRLYLARVVLVRVSL